MYGFPGLKPGDSWCLCAGRWLEAEAAGKAPPVHMNSTNIKALEIISLEVLKRYAVNTDSNSQQAWIPSSPKIEI